MTLDIYRDFKKNPMLGQIWTGFNLGGISMQKEINIGIVGCGRRGNAHADSLSRIPGARLVAVSDVDWELAKTLGERYNAQPYSDVDKMLTLPELDAVVISSPTPFHCDTILRAARNGKNIICEKPLARTLEEGEKIAQEIKNSGVKLGMFFQRRSFWIYRQLKELVPLLGEPKAVRITDVNASYSRRRGSWFADFEACGGYILDCMVHFFDVCRWYFGEVRSVQAEGLLLSQSLPEPMDYSFVNLTFENGLIASVEGGWIRRGLPVEYLYFVGTEGTIVYESLTQAIRVFTTSEKFELKGGTNESPDLILMRTFIQDLIDGKPLSPSVEDGIGSLRIALTAIESIRQGKQLAVHKECGVQS